MPFPVPSKLLSAVALALILVLICATALGQAGSSGSTRKSDHPKGLLLVANQGEHTLWVIDPGSGQKLGSITVGVNGHEVAASPDGKFAYVPIYGNSGVGKPGTDGHTIDVIDLGSMRLSRTIELGRPLRPHGAIFGADGLMYVTGELEKEIEVIDANTGKIAVTIRTNQPDSHMLAISPDGKRGYTSNVGVGSVTVLDLIARKPITVIPVTKTVQRISITPDGKRVFTCDQEKPRVAVIDTATDRLNGWIDVPSIPFASAPTPDGRWLLVALMNSNQLAVVDLATEKVQTTIAIPGGPSEILIRPDGQVAYISSLHGASVAVLNLRDWKIEKTIPAGGGSDGLAWVSRP